MNDTTTIASVTAADAMRIVTHLRRAGFTVQISGQLDLCEVAIMTENSDMAWQAFEETTERAVFAAVAAMHKELSEIVNTIAPYAVLSEEQAS
jgi:hypothetical protein